MTQCQITDEEALATLGTLGASVLRSRAEHLGHDIGLGPRAVMKILETLELVDRHARIDVARSHNIANGTSPVPDIVQRIRSRIIDAPIPTERLLDEAADEIERLRRSGS